MAFFDASADYSGAALRRKQILDAARDAFRSHGFHAASMAVVAAGAKLSVGQIYRYFDNKEAIVAAIVGEHFEEFMRDLTVVAAEEGPLSERLLNNFTQSIRRHIDSGFVSLTYEVRAEAARNPELRQILVNKDRDIQCRIVDLMKTTDLAYLSTDAICMRAEQVCLLFEGVIARLGRRPNCDSSMIITLLRPLMTAVFALAEPDGGRGKILSAESPEGHVDYEANDCSRQA